MVKMGFWRVLVTGGIVVSLCVLSVGGQNLPPCEFPAIYNFGDSNSDTGGISAAFTPIQAPYGEGFFHKPAGRDSDGRLIIDFIAERLKLPYLSAYLNSIGTNYRHGANFATGGSTITKPNVTIYEYGISPFFLDMQIQQFDQFKFRTADLYKQVKNLPEAEKLPRAEDYTRALYTFDIGQNDLSMGFRTMSFDQLKATIPDIVNQLAQAVQVSSNDEKMLARNEQLAGNDAFGSINKWINAIASDKIMMHLYKQGGTAFWIHNTGPLGCLPVNLFYVSNPPPGYLDEHGCVKSQNDMSVLFNNALKDRVIKLRTELPEAAITYVDVYSAKYGLISNAKNLGLADPLKVCCGYHVNFDHIWCGNKGIVNKTEVYGGSCKDPSVFISWDGVHYTEFAGRWVADHTQNGALTDPPTPIAQACHRR